MNRPDELVASVHRLAELRRALPIAAAVLLLTSLVFPMWRIILSAPQYPEDLMVELYAYPRLRGDVAEVQLLNEYVGFYYPDPVLVNPNFPVHEHAIAVPEWSLGPLVFFAVAGASVFVAIAPTERKLKLGLTCQLVGTLAIFGGMFALIQFRLYQAGHSLDPSAPLRGVDSFTPPVFGSYEIANISGFATFGIGGYLALSAVILVILGFLFRNSSATISDLPVIIRQGSDRITARMRPSRGGDH